MESREFFDILKNQIRNQIPFVVYKKPGVNNVKALLQNDIMKTAIDDRTESGFIFAPFNSEAESYLISSEHSVSHEFEYATETPHGELKEKFPDRINYKFPEKNQKQHEVLVQKGIDAIKEGDLKKVVLARSEQVSLHDPDPIVIFKNLLEKYNEAFVYLWFHPETNFWLGATPETLLTTERTRFKTMALAGTQVYKNTTDVPWGRKEVEEQSFVTDYILDSLEHLKAVENVQSSKPYSAKAGSLLHICTDITGYIKNTENIKDLVDALHPTPAVCGLPKQKAFQFILENEEFSREFYSGYLGEINMKSESKRNSNRKNQENQQFSAISKKTDLYVNLRCMKLKDGRAEIFVGGGITKDSDPAEEWMETVNKSQTMKSILVK